MGNRHKDIRRQVAVSIRVMVEWGDLKPPLVAAPEFSLPF